MSTPELCRIVVLGPSGRADLAVPVSTPVTALLPTLVRQMVRDQKGEEYGAWVLQRLGEQPFDANGTPETLDWLDGEELYLARAEDPLPELDFDDVAEGMAIAVNRQGNRWNETVNRQLFLSLAAAVLIAIGVVLAEGTGRAAGAVTSGALALVLCVSAVLIAQRLADRSLAAIIGTAGCWYAGLSALIAASAGGVRSLAPTAVLLGGVLLAVFAVVLLAVQRLAVAELPILPFGTSAVLGIAAILAVWLHLGLGQSSSQTATVVMCVFLILLLFAPRLATRAARLRGPQLPRNADEMTVDIEPMPAAQVVEQTANADRYLSVLAIGASVVCAVAFGYQLAAPGWLEYTIAGLVAGLVLLRSREFLNISQRLALALAGTWGAVLLAMRLLAGVGDLGRVLGVLGLLLAALMLVLAARRPAPRRMLPIWPHLGDVLENLSCIALVPCIAHMLGLFAWARGLAG
ncbi:type VII secretion integral membrane protein EccD [Kribbella sp. NPDC051587]|uniref:type VII secretion integral membrane protein EccD n=1 Tax=Kribbella sp. NPDC051587 TaxID=3364119 RepID=UPI00379FF9EC